MAVPLTLSSVPAQTPYVQYVSGVSQTVFPYPFEITQDSDLVCLINGVQQATDAGYTLSGQGTTGGGNLTFTLGQTAGTIITLYRNISIARITQLSQNGTFFSANFNNEYNRIYLILQQLQQSLLPGGNQAYALMIPNSNNPAPTTLLTPANYANKYLSFDANGNPQPTVLTSSGAITVSILGGLLYPVIASETNAGLTINTNYPYGDIRRYGIVANSAGAAAANATALQALFNPSIANGPTGNFYFPNATGSDVYYIGVLYIQIRDGVHIDLQESTLNFNGMYTSAFNGYPFLACIRDVSISNGNIVVNYNGTVNTGAGTLIQIGSRYNSIPWATYTTGILDADNLFANSLPLQGNCALRNLRISTNNPSGQVIYLTGDISNTVIENVWIDCGNESIGGIYYEFGFASTNGSPASPNLWTTSHAQNLTFRNLHIDNVLTGASNEALGANGAWNIIAEDIYVNGADVGVAFGPGEAFYYRPWVRDTSGPLAKPYASLKNLNALNVGLGAIFTGAQVCQVGTLMYASISLLVGAALYQAETDLLSFFVDGFSINGAQGIAVNGADTYDIRNGSVVYTTGSSSGGILLNDEAVRGNIENVRISNIAAQGIRANQTGTAIWATARPKFIRIAGCKIIGCSTTAIGLNNVGHALIEDNVLGASVLYDGALDAIQTIAVNVGSGCSNVTCDSNFVAVASGGTAYTITGTTSGNCNLKNPLGTSTNSGNWDVDGVANRTSTQIASKTDVVNTIGKYTGKLCQSSSTNKMLIAQGAANTSAWISTDGVTTITPS